jgi:hypothetical protein
MNLALYTLGVIISTVGILLAIFFYIFDGQLGQPLSWRPEFFISRLFFIALMITVTGIIAILSSK